MVNYRYDSKKESKRVKLPTILNEKTFSILLKVTKKSHHKLAFKLGFLCGLRISEIVHLEQEDFDRERRLIFVRQGKGGKDRYVPYPIKFISEREIKKNIPMKCGARALQIAFKNRVRRFLRREDLHFHNLRHSFATNLLGKGIPITEVQLWLGHARLNTTAIYLKVSPDAALKRYEEMWSN